MQAGPLNYDCFCAELQYHGGANSSAHPQGVDCNFPRHSACSTEVQAAQRNDHCAPHFRQPGAAKHGVSDGADWRCNRHPKVLPSLQGLQACQGRPSQELILNCSQIDCEIHLNPASSAGCQFALGNQSSRMCYKACSWPLWGWHCVPTVRSHRQPILPAFLARETAHGLHKMAEGML